jgi:hypothetical protein
MLISQRIASDPRFLESPNAKYKHLFKHTSFADIRTKVINARKFIVGREMVNIIGAGGKQMEVLWGLIGDGKTTLKEASDTTVGNAFTDRLVMYIKHARPPFPSMLVESDKGLILIEQAPSEDGKESVAFKTLSITGEGRCMPYWVYSGVVFSVFDGKEDVPFRDKLRYHFFESTENGCALAEGDLPDSTSDNLYSLGFAQVMMVMECMLFANVANTRTPVYNPTKRELKAIPKVLQPRFTYRVLDIFRDRKEYQSMEDVESLFNRSEESVQHRRAHLVRGHFKTIRGKLYWWNTFMRNRKNLESHGVVEKDYQLKK